MTKTLLRIDASARRNGSISRQLVDTLVQKLDPDTLLIRDLATALPQLDEAWVIANATPADQRNPDQVQVLAQSDALIAELRAADTIVIGVPLYNFGIPTALKAWVDLVARAGVTFRYTSAGPEGLLKGKRAILAMASGGVKAGSPIDFAVPYLKHVLGFLGISDVTVVAADQTALDLEAALAGANQAIAEIAA